MKFYLQNLSTWSVNKIVLVRNDLDLKSRYVIRFAIFHIAILRLGNEINVGGKKKQRSNKANTMNEKTSSACLLLRIKEKNKEGKKSI